MRETLVFGVTSVGDGDPFRKRKKPSPAKEHPLLDSEAEADNDDVFKSISPGIH